MGTLNLSQEMSDGIQIESTMGRLVLNGLYSLKNGPKGQKMAQNGQFSKILECMWCGYLSQEMSNKMKNESGQFYYIELRKPQKCGQN